MIGKTLVDIIGLTKGNNEVFFSCSDGTVYKMYHEQDCCESVRIEDVNEIGLENPLIGVPILKAEKKQGDKGNTDYGDIYQYTFYELSTVCGSVNIRWYGTSNGYYSVSVNFIKFEE